LGSQAGGSWLRPGRDTAGGVVGQALRPGAKARHWGATPLRARPAGRSAPTECGGLHRRGAGCYTQKKCASTGGRVGLGGRARVPRSCA